MVFFVAGFLLLARLPMRRAVVEAGNTPRRSCERRPRLGDRRRHAAPAHLTFFHGPMDCGKSTLALQVDHNQSRQGRHGLRLTQGDRSHAAQISSRVGLSRDAVEVDDATDLRLLVRDRWAAGHRVDYVVVDEASSSPAPRSSSSPSWSTSRTSTSTRSG